MNYWEQYAVASKLRSEASKNSDAEKYIEAGNAFVKLGMQAAADRCFDRADHYRKEAMSR